MRTLRILIIIQAICLFASVAADFRHTFRPKGKGSSGSGDTSGGENPPSPRDPAII